MAGLPFVSHTETQVSISPEYDTLRKCYTVLVEHIMEQPDSFCDCLFEVELVTDEVREFVNTLKESSKKARKLVDSVMRCIKKDSQVFNTFVKVLEKNSGSGKWSKTVIEHLQKTYEDCSNSANESTDIDSDTSDAESFQSTCSFQIEDDPSFVCSFCGECSLEKFFSEEGCPKKENSSDPTSMFPFLNVDALDKDEKKDLEVHLKSEARTMITTFSILCNKIKQSLCDREVPVSDVTYTLVSLKAFTTDIGVKLIEPSDKLKMAEATSFTDLFLSLDAYMSFFNYRILEHVIKIHGSPDDVKSLEEYITIFNTFCQRNVFEVPSKAFSTARKNGRKFAVKCSKDIATLKGVQVVQEQVAKIFCLRPSALQLYAIKKGCIELYFLVSSKTLKHIVILLADQQSALDMIGVKISSVQGNQKLPVWVDPHRSHETSPSRIAFTESEKCPSKQSEGSSVQTKVKCNVSRFHSSSLDEDNDSDGAGYVSCDDTLPSVHPIEEPQDKPLLPGSSFDVRDPVQPSQPPGNELQSFQQQQKLVSQLSEYLRGTRKHPQAEYETKLEELRLGAEIEMKERLRAEVKKEVQEAMKPSRDDSSKFRTLLNQNLSKNEQLSTRNDCLEKRILQLEEENKRLQSKLVAKQSTRLEDRAIQENAKFDKRAKQEKLYQGTLKKLNHIEKEKERLADALKAEEDDLEGEMKHLSTDLYAKTDKLAIKLCELADRQEECNELATACDALEKEKNDIQAQFDGTYEEKKEELVIAEDMDIELYIRLHELEDHQKELQVKHAKEIQILDESISAVESDRNEISVRAMSLGSENTQLTTDLHTKTNELERSEQTCAALTEKVTSLTSQISALTQHAVKEKIQVAGSFKTKLEEAEEQRDLFRSQKDVMMRSLTERNIENANLEAQLLDLRHRFDSETKRLREDLNEANGERMRYQMELNSLSLPSGGSRGFPYANEVGQPYQERQPSHNDYAPDHFGQH